MAWFGLGFDSPFLHHRMSEQDKLTLITAKGGFQICPHGSTYCRRCYGEQIGFHTKKAQAPSAPKKKK